MNYTGKQHDVETLAHEMGHAIHGDMSKTQPVMYEGCTISVAEVASTFFENILFNHMLDQASIIDRFDMLTTNVQQRISTIHRQIAFFQFEKKLHAAVKEKGYVSKEDMARMYIDIQKTVFGQSVDLVENDGYGYVYISHFRSFFYVYAYAYGQLIADALFAEYKKDKKFIEKVKVFLSAGMSMSPADIFKKIGIDMTKPDFFKKGLERLREDLEEVKKLAVKIGKI